MIRLLQCLQELPNCLQTRQHDVVCKTLVQYMALNFVCQLGCFDLLTFPFQVSQSYSISSLEFGKITSGYGVISY